MSHWYFDAHRTTPASPLENIRVALWMTVVLVSSIAEVDAENRGYAIEMARKEALRLPGHNWSLRAVVERVIAADAAGELQHCQTELTADGLPPPIVTSLVRAARALEPGLQSDQDLLASLEKAWAKSPLDEISLRRISNMLTR